MANILLLDNVDSFTYNLVEELRINQHHVTIFRNTLDCNFILQELKKLSDPIILLSPGPSTPKQAGCMMELIDKAQSKYPIIGICLGHQAVIEYFGGQIVKVPELLHGKASNIQHDNQDMFAKLPKPLVVARYHSLVGINIPNNFEINATVNQIVMAVKDNQRKICGFQFHPESILTTHGSILLENAINWALSFYKKTA